jgi:hypothetical protein
MGGARRKLVDVPYILGHVVVLVAMGTSCHHPHRSTLAVALVVARESDIGGHADR